MTLKQRVENALHQKCGFRYQHESWDKKLWNKSAHDIKEYLWDRFNTTLDIEEYYGCMTLLYRTMPNREILVEFKDSHQYLDRQGICTDSKNKMNESENKTKLSVIGSSVIKTVKVIGE